MSDPESEDCPPEKYMCTRSCGVEVSRATFYRHQRHGCRSRSAYGRRNVRTAVATTAAAAQGLSRGKGRDNRVGALPISCSPACFNLVARPVYHSTALSLVQL